MTSARAKIQQRLESHRLSKEEVTFSMTLLDQVVYEEVLTELAGELDDQTYTDFTSLQDQNASEDELLTCLGISQHDFVEKLIKKLKEYNANITASSEQLHHDLASL